jgi:hypothetical protein
MPCLTYLGSIEIAEDLKLECRALTKQVQQEGLYGVTIVKKNRTREEMNAIVKKVGLDLGTLINANLVSADIIMSAPLVLHHDNNLWQKYGVLIMVDVPDGSSLFQKKSDSIPIKSGDVLSIRYPMYHGLTMPNESDRLIFISVDFHVGKKVMNETWQSKIAAWHDNTSKEVAMSF